MMQPSSRKRERKMLENLLLGTNRRSRTTRILVSREFDKRRKQLISCDPASCGSTRQSEQAPAQDPTINHHYYSHPSIDATYILERIQDTHFDLNGFGGGSFVVTHGCLLVGLW